MERAHKVGRNPKRPKGSDNRPVEMRGRAASKVHRNRRLVRSLHPTQWVPMVSPLLRYLDGVVDPQMRGRNLSWSLHSLPVLHHDVDPLQQIHVAQHVSANRDDVSITARG